MNMRTLDNFAKKHNNIHAKVGVFVLSLVIVMLSLHGRAIKVQAAEDFSDHCDGVVSISIMLNDASGNSCEIRNGCAICIGDSEGGISTLITTSHLVTVTEEDYTSFYETYEVPEEEREKITTEIVVSLTKDISTSATISTNSNDLDLAVLKLNQTIYDREVYLFDLDHDTVVGDTVYAIGNPSYGYQTGTYSNAVVLERNNYIEHDIVCSAVNEGGALLNEKGELIGMNQSGNYGEKYYALDATDIASVLNVLGVSFQAADHTDYSADFTSLESTLAVASNINLSGYTKESKKQMTDAIANAQAVLENEDATQEEVDAAVEGLLSAQNGLTLDKSMSLPMILALIGIGVLVLTIIILILVMVIGKKKRLQREQEAAELEAKRPEVVTKPYSPMQYSMPQYQNSSESSDASGGAVQGNPISLVINPAPEKGNASSSDPVGAIKTLESGSSVDLKKFQSGNSGNLKGFAHMSNEPKENFCDHTTILGDNFVNKPQPKRFALKNRIDNQMFYMTKAQIRVGKMQNGNDLIVESDVVSRQHAILYLDQNQVFVQDMNSKNGTYINGRRLMDSSIYPLQVGDEVAFADQIYVVCAG